MARSIYNDAVFSNIHSEGQLLPLDTLQRIVSKDKSVEGISEEQYGLYGDNLGEAINQAWTSMRNAWRKFSIQRQKLAQAEKGTTLTRSHLLLPLFEKLGYGQLSQAKAEERQVTLPDGRQLSYPISHFRYESPIHLVSFKVSLDSKTAGETGASRQSPHSLVQEFLNRSDDHLWGFVSNGLILRVLRDNASFSRQAYVEFDLEGIFEGESYIEFAVLWMVCHCTRVHTDGQPPEQCWLEKWQKQSQSVAVAALDTLRSNVTRTIEALGQGFIDANAELRDKLSTGTLGVQAYYHQLQRLAYRLIFLFVVEDRGLLLAPGASQASRDRYRRFYSLMHLRRLSAISKGTKHHDLWEGVKLVMSALGRPEGCAQLDILPMGGFLWSDEIMPDLQGLRLRNADLLEAIRRLAFTRYNFEMRPIDWRHLGAQELGSVYESLLELHPELTQTTFELKQVQGNDRKTTGSYYTPTQLIESLLETALDPVIDQAVRDADNPEAALLDLKICDPACGSGHFLLAAARRVAKRLAQIRTGDTEPAPAEQRRALRDVAGRCIYGIDINAMSLELCKVGLWLETHEAGKPLHFLDHHLVCANSLLGTTAEHIKKGIPAEAYAALEGDDKKACTNLKKRNAKQFEMMLSNSLLKDQFEQDLKKLAELVRTVKFDEMPADTMADMEKREEAFCNWRASAEWQKKKRLYDMWTAAFVLPRYFPQVGTLSDGSPRYDANAFGITWNTLTNFAKGQVPSAEILKAVDEAVSEYQFFHYEVAFPEVAAKGGFDVILGNPPWEKIKLTDTEWFKANNYSEIADIKNPSIRKKAILALEKSNPILYHNWIGASYKSLKYSHYYHNSGLFPLCGQGDINLYAVFAEWMRNTLNHAGRIGCIVPSGIATDNTTKLYFQDIIKTKCLISLYDFENKNFFKDVHKSYKFCLLTLKNNPGNINSKFIFYSRNIEDLKDNKKCFTLSYNDISLINPNTFTCPIFKNQLDAELIKSIYRQIPVLLKKDENRVVQSNPWQLEFGTMYHMTSDAGLFYTREQLEKKNATLINNIFYLGEDIYLPLYESKMIHQFRSRWGTFDYKTIRNVYDTDLKNTNYYSLPLYWVLESNILSYYKKKNYNDKYIIGLRDVTNTTNERTVISTIIPNYAVGNNINLIFCKNSKNTSFALISIFNSFIFDYIARQKVGGVHLNFFITHQLPVIHPSTFIDPTPWSKDISLADWLRPRVVELTYTAEDMRPFAEDMGFDDDPFVWDEDRRFELRTELDACFFHLYLPANTDGTWKKHDSETADEYKALIDAFPTPRDAVDYVMDSFPIVRKKDEKAYGNFRTKEAILAKYDEMMDAIRSNA